MLISSSKLIGMRVETKDGIKLGKLIGFNIDIDNHLIINYKIKTKLSIEKIFDNLLLISPSQIVEIKKDKIIVENSCFKNAKKKTEDKKTIIKDAEPISLSKKL